MPQNVYQRTTKRAQALLDRPEGIDVEFKRTIQALNASTLVAFANSPDGGTVLVGVEEYTAEEGLQRGRPVGCAVDDQARLMIINKAIECVPSVAVWLVAENVSRIPFFRVEIHGSAERPHSTSSGVYKIREDGRNKPLLPNDILAMLLEREGVRFQERFDQATEGVIHQLGAFEGEVTDALSHMSSALGWAETNTEFAKSTLDELNHRLERDLGEGQERFIALLKHLDVLDPVKARVTQELKALFKEELRQRPEVLSGLLDGQSVSLTISGDPARLLSEEELNAAALEAARELAEEGAESTTPPETN